MRHCYVKSYTAWPYMLSAIQTIEEIIMVLCVYQLPILVYCALLC